MIRSVANVGVRRQVKDKIAALHGPLERLNVERVAIDERERGRTLGPGKEARRP
jgi:hypothetical protein